MTPQLPETIELEHKLDDPDDEAFLRASAARKLGVAPDELPALVLRKRSLDCRKGRVRIRRLMQIGPEPERPLAEPDPKEVKGPSRVVIVGDGPAGLFCAYELARHGVPCTVVDRGKAVQPRRRDLKGLHQKGIVDPDSNYCFGEGGAGTYSDGKLYTRSHKRGDVRDVLEILALHGAPSEILVEARPHIGSNRLPNVVTAIRERLEGVGVRFRFSSRVVGIPRDHEQRVQGVRLQTGEELAADYVVLATGHSARDILSMLHEAGLTLESKPFALGVRIEHPQASIDRIQYGAVCGHPKLPAAAYRLADSHAKRPVFSFCMCPGGFIVPASTAPGELVVNGMSLSRRDSRYANSGLVVGVEPASLEALGWKGPFAGIELQRAIEQRAFQVGGSRLEAPATRVTDFLAGRASSTVPKSSYIPGLTAANIADVLDVTALRFADRLREALRRFGQQLRGYVTEEAVLVGIESRTSCPVRIPRGDDLTSLEWPGLYPCGEGAGYAGGIVSAAVDGMRVARQIVLRLSS